MIGFSFQENILKWLSFNLHFFDPRRKSKTTNDSIKLKAFIELIFLYNMFNKGEIFDRNKKCKEKIEKLILEVIDEIEFNNYSILETGFLPVPAIVEEYYQVYFDNERRCLLLQKQLDYCLDVTSRKTPYRYLDVKYSVEKAGMISNLQDDKIIFLKTTLGKMKNPLFISDDMAYSITHAIFYLTDMGRKSVTYLLEEKYDDLIFSLITYYQFKKNMDILSELIISIFFLGRKLTVSQKKILEKAIFQLYSCQNFEKGYVPSPAYAVEVDSEKDFFENYHTTMVALGASFLYENNI